VGQQREALLKRYTPFVVSTLRTGGLYALPILARPTARQPLARWLPFLIGHVPSTEAVALTFDDGPGKLLDNYLLTLDRGRARATFFLVGEQVERDPKRAAAIVQAGHEVAVHCYQHIPHLRSWPRDVVNDMRRAKAVIEDAIGGPTHFYRPPHGVFSLASWREARRLGWTRAAWDWTPDATPESIAARIGRPSAGEVLLLHDADWYAQAGSDRRTLLALPLIFDRLQSVGLQARTLGELVNPRVFSREARLVESDIHDVEGRHRAPA
jgi:peptidoglycan/xylan/chitin deacetylase (PgdA/CDA1 family)